MRITLKEKGLPMIGNFFPKFDFDNYWYKSYYDPKEMRTVYEAHKAEILEDDKKEGNQHLEDKEIQHSCGMEPKKRGISLSSKR